MLAAAPVIGPKAIWRSSEAAGQVHGDRRTGHVAGDEVHAAIASSRRCLVVAVVGEAVEHAGHEVGQAERRLALLLHELAHGVHAGDGRRWPPARGTAGANWLPATVAVSLASHVDRHGHAQLVDLDAHAPVVAGRGRR
jgi:hypothetical protein